MKPADVMNSKKSLGLLKIEDNNPFFTLPLTIEGKPIMLEIEGKIHSEEVIGLSQFGQFKMPLDVSANGELKLMAASLTSTLKLMMEQETLPDLKLIVNTFVVNDIVYTAWPKYKTDFTPVMYKGKVIKPTDAEVFGEMIDTLRKSDTVTVITELYVWARQDHEKHELVVGFTPRIKSIL